MTDIKRLNDIIIESGLKKIYIADKLGITLQGLLNKLDGKSEFKASEIYKVCEVLNITDSKEIKSIFFAQDVEC